MQMSLLLTSCIRGGVIVFKNGIGSGGSIRGTAVAATGVVIELDAAEVGEVPIALIATTVNV